MVFISIIEQIREFQSIFNIVFIDVLKILYFNVNRYERIVGYVLSYAYVSVLSNNSV